MADYIDKNILCQAYVHVELPADITPERLEAIREHLRDFTDARARFFVYPEVEVEVEFKEGSLKAYLTVAGCIYAAVCGYGGFRSGIDYLHTDIKRLADTLVAESLFMTRARHDDIRRTEARTGVIGSIKKLIDDIIILESSIGHVGVEDVARRIRQLHDDAEQILSNVADSRDFDAIEDEMIAVTGRLPENCPHPKERGADKTALLVYQESLVLIRRRFGKKKKGLNQVPEPTQ